MTEFGKIVLALLACVSAAGAEWTLGRTGSKAVEQSVAFADGERGYVAGIGSVVRTDNGGKSYSRVADRKTFGGAFWFNSVATVSRDAAVVSGFAYGKPQGGIVAYTADGGTTWTKSEIPGNGEVQFTGATFTPDRKTGYVLGNGKGLYRTVDGGKNWTRVQSAGHADRVWIATKRAISCPDNHTVVAWSGRNRLIRSDDGGQSWKTIPIQTPDKKNVEVLMDLYFATPERGWIWGLGTPAPRYETRDGGKTWQRSTAPFGMVYFSPDGKTGWSFGSGYQIAETADGGVTWSSPQTIFPGAGGINSVAVAGDRVYAAGGQEGTGLSFIASSALPGVELKKKITTGILPIHFELAAAGKVSIQIRNGDGEVVANPVRGETFGPGAHTVYWDLTTLDDFWPPFERTNPYQYQPPEGVRKIAAPGRYTWRGVYHAGLRAQYEGAFYPLVRGNTMPWVTANKTGGWLGDHEPPHDVLDDGESMWLGGFAEGGDSLIETDLEMRKKWGVSRIQLACARLLARSEDKLYFVDLGGWLGHGGQVLSIIELDKRAKSSRRVVSVAKNESAAAAFPKPDWHITAGNIGGLTGFAILDGKAYLADRAGNRIAVLDLTANLADPKNQRAKLDGFIEIPAPGRIRPYNRTHFAVAAEKGLYLVETAGRRVRKIADLVNGCGLAVDPAGNFYVGELAPLHQVKKFSPAGKLLRIYGKPGIHDVGPFDPQNLESPTGLAIDKNGNLWVAEHSYEIKRASVWNPAGTCVKDVHGPTVYGGGGALDPENPNRAFYRGNELVRGRDGKFTLKNVFWRLDTDRFDSFLPENRPHSFSGQAPTHPFRRDGKLYFRMWGGHAMGDVATLFVYDDAKRYARPAAAAGQIQQWMRAKFAQIPAGHDIFAWTDRNDNGKVEFPELKTGKLGTANAVWGCKMGTDFNVAFSTVTGRVGLAFFEVESTTPQGFPVYRLPTAYHYVPNLIARDPNQVQCVANDGRGNAVAIANYIFSMNRSGKLNWRYKCRWPGLHSGLGSTALGNEPGLMLAPIRIWGIEPDAKLGEIIAIGTNYGAVDFFSGDGIYLDRMFLDSRLGRSWRFERPPTPRELAEASLGQEHFGGAYQRAAGRDKLIVAGGGNTCAIVGVSGFETAEKLPGGSLEVTPGMIARADRELQRRSAEIRTAREYVVPPGRDWNRKTAIAGFKLGYDAKNLYLRYDGVDSSPFRNAVSPDDFAEAFTSGDVLDLMIARDPAADPKRPGAVRGDLRISLVPRGDGAMAILYDYVSPGAPAERRRVFASPTGAVTADRVVRLEGAKITVRRRADRVTVEAEIPLDELGLTLKPGLALGGDVGRVVSDATGTTRIDRVYWSNANTRIVKDLPSEARLQPNLWGTFRFQ